MNRYYEIEFSIRSTILIAADDEDAAMAEFNNMSEKELLDKMDLLDIEPEDCHRVFTSDV